MHAASINQFIFRIPLDLLVGAAWNDIEREIRAGVEFEERHRHSVHAEPRPSRLTADDGVLAVLVAVDRPQARRRELSALTAFLLLGLLQLPTQLLEVDSPGRKKGRWAKTREALGHEDGHQIDAH